MKSVKRWIRNWLSDEETATKVRELPQGAIGMSGGDFEDDRSIRFNITPARGGMIVTVKNYNQRHDKTDTVVHIIHDNDEIADNIARIVTMEMLSRGN